MAASASFVVTNAVIIQSADTDSIAGSPSQSNSWDILKSSPDGLSIDVQVPVSRVGPELPRSTPRCSSSVSSLGRKDHRQPRSRRRVPYERSASCL